MATLALYQLVFLLAFVLWAPVLAWRMVFNPGYRRGVRERMGWVPPSIGPRPVVWVHGVSVGEVKAGATLIQQLRRQLPGHDLVLSATTPNGYALACRLHPELRVFHFPLDFGLFPRRALDRVRPACVLLIELEIWPNFLDAAERRDIPVIVVNGRMSERSFRGYRWVRGLLPQFHLIRRYCVQDESYRERLIGLGVAPSRVFVTGNLKYDAVALRSPPATTSGLRQWLSADGRLVLVGGSTHHDEEIGLARTVAAVASQLRAPVRLVLAPRHPERAAAVREALQNAGWPSVSWSSKPFPQRPLADAELVLVDTIGHLEAFYAASDIAFVGGSLVPHGGQNMLEPAALGRAVVFGPHVTNFRTDVKLLCGAEAALAVDSWQTLAEALASLWLDPGRREALGKRAVEVIGANQGATARTLELLQPWLGDLDHRLVPIGSELPERPGVASRHQQQDS